MIPEIRALLDLSARDATLRRALEPLGRDGRACIGGLSPSAAGILLPALLEAAPGGKIILLVQGEAEAERFHHDITFAADATRGPACRVHLFPSLEADPYQELEPHRAVACDRVAALRALREPGQAIIVAPARALIYPLARPATFDLYRFDLQPKQTVRPDDLSQYLLSAGYLRVDLVSAMGEFSRRGGIIDIYPPEGPGPVRVEFWGEEIESLRRFDPATQRSAAGLDRAMLPPVREYPWSAAAIERLREALATRRRARQEAGYAAAVLAGPDDLLEKIEALASGRLFPGFEACVRLVDERPASLLDYAPGALSVTWEKGQVLSDLEAVYLEMHQSLDLTETFGMPPPEDLLIARQEIMAHVSGARLELDELGMPEDDGARRSQRVPCAPPRSYRGRLQELANDLGRDGEATTTLFVMNTAGRIERLAEVLQELGRPPRVVTAADAPSPPGAAVSRLLVMGGRLSRGFELPGASLRVLTEREVFGEHAEREGRRRRVAAFSSDFRDLKVGDLVVHVEHGVGRYAGITRVGEGEAQRDFMLLTYEGGDKLYVHIDRLDLVQRYSGIAGQRPRLDRLGGTGWEKTKKKVRKAMQEMAADLLQLYAERKSAQGHAFPADTPWQKEFEDAFPYATTPDQEKAIREVTTDMERDVPMDRLICGDVGFGKTEVAMRAAFKAVMDGRQVAVLCPTTVLAFQHLNTFRERFSSWPATIEMVSRFRSPREQKATLKALSQGAIDILIGTHRLLSRDVHFRDLGLLVVDEEQRFGVAHKEAIKALKKNVDVLTLTATPIPRTLQMSLAGIRDMSVIETPPEDRLAIQTSIVPFKEGVIAAAVRHELKRGGQVYFVHNRVESIGSMANYLRRVVPEVRLAVAHGQMSEGVLEKTMIGFLQGEFDLLLATTIIENGLDIPRVNTIVVNRADRFGLAQLYQLRGRVGRSDRRAYAYLLVPGRKALTPVARRRLKALQEFTELGSGFRIAAMDLEIRGAGNLLGGEQSGHIASVGFEMYCQLLERTVRDMKGEAAPPEFKTQISLGVDIRIPDDYIPDFGERLALYKRISSAADEREIERSRQQIRDLYGELPRQAESLLALAAVRLLAERLRARAVEFSGGRLQIRLADDAAVPAERLVAFASGRHGASLTPAGVLRVELPPLGDRERIAAGDEVLRALLPCDSISHSLQSSAAGPANEDR